MKMTAPLAKKHIQFAREVFALGYRTVLPDKKTALFGAALVKDRYLKLGIPWDLKNNPSSVVSPELNVNEGMYWWWFIKMARNKWVIPMSSTAYMRFISSGMFKQNRIHNVTCYIIKNNKRGEDDQHTFQRNNFYMVRAKLRDKAYSIIRSIFEAGIDNMWRENAGRQELRRSEMKKNCREGLCEDEGKYAPLKFNSPVKIVIFWHLIFCCGGLIAFVFEKAVKSAYLKRNTVVRWASA
jgi:hypothetical protein